MPKTETRQQTAKNEDAARNGRVAATENRAKQHEFTDFIEVEEAKTEFSKRKKTQLGLIKKTDKKLLRAMLFEMVLGRVFEEKSAGSALELFT